MAARRRKVHSTPFPPGGENCVRSLAPPLPGEPASLGFAGSNEGLGKTPPGTAPDEHFVLIVAFPRTPVYGGYPLKRSEHLRRAKSGVLERHSVRPHWGPEFAKSAFAAVSLLRLSFLSQRSRFVFYRRGAQCAPDARDSVRAPARIQAQQNIRRRGGTLGRPQFPGLYRFLQPCRGNPCGRPSVGGTARPGGRALHTRRRGQAPALQASETSGAGGQRPPLQLKTGRERWFGSGRRRNKTAPVPIFFPLRPPVGPDGIAPKHSWYCAPEGPHNVQGVTPVNRGPGKAVLWT